MTIAEARKDFPLIRERLRGLQWGRDHDDRGRQNYGVRVTDELARFNGAAIMTIAEDVDTSSVRGALHEAASMGPRS